MSKLAAPDDGRDQIPAVVYAARSQAEELGKDSTGDQVALVLARLQRESDRFVVGEPHVDHASGFKGNRGPGLEAAIRAGERAAREHGRAELWVWITSRLGRGTGYAGHARAIGHLLYELRAKGVTVRSVEDDEFATNEMLWGFASRMASKYSEDLAANVQRGIASRIRAGKPWGTPAYGYAAGDDGHWIVDLHEADVVHRIFAERVDRGLSYSGIAKLLNHERIPTRHGASWAAPVVQRILTTRAVRGEFHHAGEWRQGRHLPIIDEETWQAAQVVAERGRKYAPRGAGRIPKRHLFVQGALRCICGAAMLPRSDGDVYVCRRRKMTHGTDACSVPPIKRAAIEAPLLRMFHELALDVDGTRDRLAEALEGRLDSVRAEADRAAGEAAAKRAQIQRVERDYLVGDLSAPAYERLTAHLADELAAAAAERTRLEAHAAHIAQATASLDAEQDALERLARLREQVGQHITRATAASEASGDISALRAAIGAVFDHVDLDTSANAFAAGVARVAEPDRYGELYLLPHLRDGVVRDVQEWPEWREDGRFLNLIRVPVDLPAQNRTGSGVPL